MATKQKIIFRSIILLIIIFTLSLIPRLLKLFSPEDYYTNYAIGSYLLHSKSIVFDHHLQLIGQQAQRTGFAQGAGVYYLLAIPLILMNGSPFSGQVFSFTISVAIILCPFILWRLFGNKEAIFIGIFLGISPFLNFHTLDLWPPYVVPLLMVIYLISFLLLLERKKKKYFLFMTVSLGLIPHFEIASLALIFPSYLLLTGYLIYKKYILLTDLLWVGAIFFLTFLPHLIYDLSHNFYNLRGILAVLPNSNYVTENADFYTRLIDRVHLVNSDLRAAFPSVPMKFLYLFLGTIIIGSYAFMRNRSVAKNKKLFILNLYFTLSLSFIVLFLLPFPKAEIWWIPYFSIIYIFITGIILRYLWDFKSIIFKFLVLIILFIFIKSETERVFQMIYENSILKEQKYNIKVQEPVEYIYKDSKGMSFNILYITEEIYVLSYKYMFWYIGHTKYPNSKGFKNLDLDYILPGGPAVPLNKKGQFNNLEKGLYYVIITQKSIDSGYASKYLKYPVGKLVETKNFENNYVLQKHVIE